MIDRDQLREALDRLESLSPSFREPVVEEAARLVASEDTLTISKVDIDLEGAAREYTSLSYLNFEPERAVRILLATALGSSVLDALLEGQPK